MRAALNYGRLFGCAPLSVFGKIQRLISQLTISTNFHFVYFYFEGLPFGKCAGQHHKGPHIVGCYSNAFIIYSTFGLNTAVIQWYLLLFHSRPMIIGRNTGIGCGEVNHVHFFRFLAAMPLKEVKQRRPIYAVVAVPV